MNDSPTLFDMVPLTPAEVIRRSGRHPVTMLPLDPDETHTCGNCATRRWIFDETTCEWHDTVCAVLSRCAYRPDRGMVAYGPPDPDDFCVETCCTAWDQDPGWSRPWPWDEHVTDDLPACLRWTDLDAESVVTALRGRPA